MTQDHTWPAFGLGNDAELRGSALAGGGSGCILLDEVFFSMVGGGIIVGVIEDSEAVLDFTSLLGISNEDCVTSDEKSALKSSFENILIFELVISGISLFDAVVILAFSVD